VAHGAYDRVGRNTMNAIFTGFLCGQVSDRFLVQNEFLLLHYYLLKDQ
jgi:hypothetical protein